MESKSITIGISNGWKLSVPEGITFAEIEKSSGMEFKYPPLAARENNELRTLSEEAHDGCNVSFIDGRCEEGRRIYRYSMVFMMLKAFYKLFPNASITVDHSVTGGVWCTPNIGETFRSSHMNQLKEEMIALSEQNIPFNSSKVKVSEAIEIFKKQGNHSDTLRLFECFDNTDEIIELYNCGGYVDYMLTRSVPHTGYLKVFDLLYYPPGFILRFPRPKNPLVLSEFNMERQIFKKYSEFKQLGKAIQVSDVADLNASVVAKETQDIVRVSEAIQEKKLAEIADMIYRQKDNIKVILIAGPSSSGKTTFAGRLGIQLRINGMKPVAISVDDYFVDREHTPRDENGEYDFEVLEALDLNLFNEHLEKLLAGEEIELPRFDFAQGKRFPSGKKLKLQPNQPVVIEGLHGLNDRLTESVARENKFKIYISPLTSLNLDNHNRIHTTDTRIIRRIVRDKLYRGRDALGTLKKWDSVRRGERLYIFPFQEEADVMFNSFLVYEISVLRNFVEEPLKNISNEHPEYSEAQRLLKLLQFFRPIGTEDIPQNSIIREFIGKA